jgi:HEAT repeat protein
MEGQLLPRAELKPAYDKAVWLYLYRDFSGNDADEEAERSCLRLGFSSYPRHVLLDPATLEPLADTGRAVESFLAAVGRAKVHRNARVLDLAAADERAADLERSGSAKAAAKALDDEDVLVQYRAVEILATKAPKEIVRRAEALLAVGNDPLRYVVCDALAKTGDDGAAKALEAVVEKPEKSTNPNVLRIRAVAALGACGDKGSVGAIAPHAAGPWNNGLTRTAVDALVAIAKRVRPARAAVRAALAASYPEPPAAGDDDRARRAILALAKHVHDALEDVAGKKVPFPDTYDAAARAKLEKSW